jgi:hypothetical protein
MTLSDICSTYMALMTKLNFKELMTMHNEEVSELSSRYKTILTQFELA